MSTVGAGDRISWLFKTCPPLRTASTGSLKAILLGSVAAAFTHKRSLSAEFQLPNWFGDGTGLFFFFPLSWYVMRGFRDMLNYWLSCRSSQTRHCRNISVWRKTRVDVKQIENSTFFFFSSPQKVFSPKWLLSSAGLCSGSSSLLEMVISTFCLIPVIHIILIRENIMWCWALTPFLSAAYNLQLLLTSVGLFFIRLWGF